MNSENETIQQLEQINSAVDNSFFYTSEKFISNLDIASFLEYLQHYYPLLTPQSSDSQLKHTLLQILSNDEFMNAALEVFNITIFDFFKLLTSNYGILFKGAFLKKVKKEIEQHTYIKTHTIRKTH